MRAPTVRDDTQTRHGQILPILWPTGRAPMAVTLSTQDLDGLQAATQTLLSPLAYPTVDGWRSAVNGQLRALLRADSAGFFLPVREGLILYSDDHDPRALARYPEYPPPPLAGGVDVWERMKRLGVGTLADLYGADLPRYLESVYYNEYAAANQAHDTISATVPVASPGPGMASLHLWHARPQRAAFGDREVALLRLLFPAFQAGVVSCLRWACPSEAFLRTLDDLREPALVADASGQVVHRTASLERLVAADPERARLEDAMAAIVRGLRGVTCARTGEDAPLEAPLQARVRTRAATYRVHGALMGDAPAGGPALGIVRLDRVSTPVPPSEALRERFGLTRRQAEVAALLVQRKTTPEIAEALTISPHTARHHTESVLAKLGVGDRRQVARVVAEALDTP